MKVLRDDGIFFEGKNGLKSVSMFTSHDSNDNMKQNHDPNDNLTIHIFFREEKDPNDISYGKLKTLLHVIYPKTFDLQEFGMPKCDSSDNDTMKKLFNNRDLRKTKMEAVIEHCSFPFHTPMKIVLDKNNTLNKEAELFFYKSDNKLACVLYTYSTSYNQAADTYFSTKDKYKVLSIKEAYNLLQNNGINLDIPSQALKNVVNSRDYKGIRGFLNRLHNRLDHLLGDNNERQT